MLTEVAKGKSVGRALFHSALRRWHGQLDGLVLDLACKRQPGYWRVLGLDGNPRVQLVGVDYEQRFRPTVVADLTKSLPFHDAVADAIICANFFYIHPEPTQLLLEIRRVLKVGGVLLLTAPLVYPYNPEPTDFYRFTEKALERLLEGTGFFITDLIPLGDRWTAAEYLLGPFLRPHWLTGLLVIGLCLLLDRATHRFFKRWPPCPIGYLIRACTV